MGNLIYLKQAEPKDSKFLWQLRNYKNIRRNFLNNSFIPYDKHLFWFRDRLSSYDARIFIVKNDRHRRIGYVRFEKEKDGIWKISVAISPTFQGKGYGSLAIKMGCRKLFEVVNVKRVVAYMLKGNRASFNAFQKAGFVFKNKRLNEGNVILLELKNSLK